MRVKIKDIGKTITGKTPSTKEKKFFGGDILFITPSDITNGGYIGNTERHITKLGYDSIKNNTLSGGVSILIGCIGSDMGNVSWTDKICASNQQINSITNIKKEINPWYIYYKLSQMKLKFKQLAGSTTTPILPKSVFDEIVLELQEKSIQDKITNLIMPIDKKIELNNKINSELEDMAKTIYDYWFLQFEFPNDEGKPYKSSGGKMVWNEELKKEIPDGWEVINIKNCIKHIKTGLNPRNNFKLGNGNIKYITVKNLTTSGNIDFSNCDLIDEKAKQQINKRSEIRKGDILFASIAPLGRCFIIQETPKDWEINESVFSIRPDYDKISSEYLYMFFMSEYFIKKAEASSTGSIFSGIRINTIENMKILVPNKKIIDFFTAKISSLFYKKFKNNQENQELIFLRDYLLPLLMNGQVGFKE